MTHETNYYSYDLLLDVQDAALHGLYTSEGLIRFIWLNQLQALRNQPEGLFLWIVLFQLLNVCYQERLREQARRSLSNRSARFVNGEKGATSCSTGPEEDK